MIKICNFRCFVNKKIIFNKGINILTGLNATGKTSILESINYLALTKSFKTNNEADIIKTGCSEMSVCGIVVKKENEVYLKIFKNHEGKAIFKDSYKFSKISDFLGEMLVVVFSNNDLTKLNGYSKDRRKIFEPIICQISKVYIKWHSYYNKLLNDRNALLKSFIHQKNNKLFEVVKVLNHQLVEVAKEIIKIRKEIVKKINEKITYYHSLISSANESVEIKYKPNVDPEKMFQELERGFDFDLKRGTTSIGPHKDDYEFIINGKNVVNYGSQGQQRNILISAKLTFVELLKNEKNENPILLLDDVFSELDSIRQNNLFKAIGEDIQTIISTSTLSEIDKNIIEKATIITLKKEEIGHE